jgi:hypothetical protein
VKDNFAKQFWYDTKDGNILRTDQMFKDIFKAAGLKIITE